MANNMYITNREIQAYVEHKKRVNRDKAAFRWQLNLCETYEEKMAYAELLDTAIGFIEDIEADLNDRQKEVNQCIHFECNDSLDQACLKLSMSRPTLYRERQKINQILTRKWKQYEWWFDAYMSCY